MEITLSNFTAVTPSNISDLLEELSGHRLTPVVWQNVVMKVTPKGIVFTAIGFPPTDATEALKLAHKVDALTAEIDALQEQLKNLLEHPVSP